MRMYTALLLSSLFNPGAYANRINHSDTIKNTVNFPTLSVCEGDHYKVQLYASVSGLGLDLSTTDNSYGLLLPVFEIPGGISCEISYTTFDPKTLNHYSHNLVRINFCEGSDLSTYTDAPKSVVVEEWGSHRNIAFNCHH